MLEQASRLRLDELSNHIAQDGADGVEALVRGADVVEAIVVEQYFLHNEYGHRLAELRARLHDAEAERDDLGGQEEVDDVGRVVLDQGTDDAEAREAQVFKGPRLGRRVEEGVQEEGDVGCESTSARERVISRVRRRTVEEQGASVVVRCHALQECQGVADAIGGGRGELGGIEESVDGNDFLQERGHDA